jgi:predicted O-methyltransferase YrrM
MSRRTLPEALAAVANVDGWMSPDQAERLYGAACRVVAGGQIVEIGSFRGRSMIVLASAAADEVRLVAIDPHAGNDRGPQEIDGYEAEAATDHEVFLANLSEAGVADRVRHVRMMSTEAHTEVDGTIDVLYIDGAHRYAPARQDIDEWGRRVAAGGSMLIHDAFSSIGVTAAILRTLLWSDRFTYVGRSRSLAEYRAAPPPSRLRNAARQAAQLPWWLRNVGLKVLLTVRLGGVLRRITGRTPEWPY